MATTTHGGPEHDPITVLQPVTSPKAWGEELWLDSARPEGMARLAGGAPALGLAEWLARDPRPLGRQARALFGDAAPVFTKIIRTDFPPLVHVGFRRRVERDALLGLLAAEQEGLRALRQALAPGRAAFDGFMRRYAAWATAQALARWQIDDAATLAADLGLHVAPAAVASLPATLTALRRNRAAFVDLLNEIDFAAEAGSLFVIPAGTMHAIFGLSHQTHPLDPSRRALCDLFAALAAARARGAAEPELDALIAAAPLGELRRAGQAPPKNEAWLPLRLDGQQVIVEPQQSSDTTYSLADFYTPFVWADDAAGFRKGDRATGLPLAQIEGYLQSVDLEASPLERIRRRPEPVALPGAPVALSGAPVALPEAPVALPGAAVALSGAPVALPGAAVAQAQSPARLFRLVDEPEAWPFFTTYVLELDGSPTRPAVVRGAPPAGVYQSVVVLEGAVTVRATGRGGGPGGGPGEGPREGLGGEPGGVPGEGLGAPHPLAARTAAWVSGDAVSAGSGRYLLSAETAAKVLFVSVPGAHGGAPRVERP